ncbi:MAG: methionyl-tRNA formyltransferase, partial [Desulfomonilia bacterium]
MKLVFMGTPEFALPSLKALIAAPEHEVLVVVTQPDKPSGRGQNIQMPPVKQEALIHGIPVLQPRTLKGNAEFADAIIGLKPDAVIVVAYGKMIPEDLLRVPPFGFINVHASLLPSFRGAAPINRAILEGCSTSGVSIMKVDAGMDSGPVFTKSEVPVPEDMDAPSLSSRLSVLGAEKLLETLALLEQGRIEPVPQDHDRATYAPMLKKEEGEIDWNRSPRQIHNMVRGLLPWPCAYSFMSSKTLKILKSSYVVEEHELPPGVMAKGPEGLRVACRGGFLIPEVLQLEGKKAMDARAFSNGLHTPQ